MARRYRAAPRRRFRRARRVATRARRATHRVAVKSRRFFGGMPRWAKPSNFTAGVGVADATAQLIFTPIPNGSGGQDSWVMRLAAGLKAFKQSGDPSDLLASDGVNDITSIAAMQLRQNSLPAIGTVAGFGVVASIERYFGL